LPSTSSSSSHPTPTTDPHPNPQPPTPPNRLSDFTLGKKLATGGFGEVFRAVLTNPSTGEETDVVLKRADEFGEANFEGNAPSLSLFSLFLLLSTTLPPRTLPPPQARPRSG